MLLNQQTIFNIMINNNQFQEPNIDKIGGGPGNEIQMEPYFLDYTVMKNHVSFFVKYIN